MDARRPLKQVAKEFDLKFNQKSKFKFLVLTKREIIICNFLAGSPDPIHVKHGNKDKKKVSVNLIKYLQTEDYKKDVNKPQACIISQKGVEEQIKLVLRIPNKKIKKCRRFY